MSLENSKPEPLRLGSSYFFTLESYDPVEVELYVPMVTDFELNAGVEALIHHYGGDPKSVDDAWVKEHIDGADSLEELRNMLRNQGKEMNAQMVEESKSSACARQLSLRLVQSVPQEQIDAVAQMLQASFEADLQHHNLTKDEFLSRSGSTSESFDAMMKTQARAMAEQDAALEAFAQERKITVSEDEYPSILRMPAEHVQKLIEDAKSHNQLDQLKRAATCAKALSVVMAEAKVSYHHETAEEAERRIADHKRAHEMESALHGDGCSCGCHHHH